MAHAGRLGGGYEISPRSGRQKMLRIDPCNILRAANDFSDSGG
jgi:hypothetical protein